MDHTYLGVKQAFLPNTNSHSLLPQHIAGAADHSLRQEATGRHERVSVHCRQWRYLDGDTEHEAEEELVLLKQAAAYIAVQGVGHVLHQAVDPGSQHVRRRCLRHTRLGCKHGKFLKADKE